MTAVSRPRQIAIYGAGGFAREVAWLISALDGCDGRDRYEIVGYVEDEVENHRSLNELPVLTWEQVCTDFPAALMTVAVGSPVARERLVRKCIESKFEFACLIHQSVEMSKFVTLGIGSIICCGTILTVNIDIGAHVHINLDCTIGHDVQIGDFATLAPGVHVSGNVHIGRGAYIGTGATIINGTNGAPLTIGEGSVIAAGACVTHGTEPRALYAGVPAELKKRYASV